MTPKMYLDMGIELVMQGDSESAVLAFCKAIALNPNYSPAYNNLGLILRNTERLAEAEACFRRAIDLNPDDPSTYNNLGLVLMDLGHLDKAEDCFHRAIELNPHQPQFYNNLGTMWEEKSCLPEAQAAYCRAIELDSYYPEAHYNMGGLFRLTKHIDEAEIHLRHALTLRPNYSEATLALALLYFLQGRFKENWDSYEKSRQKRCSAKELGIPLWQGEDLTECNILLFWEYGFGDTLQFVRYAQKVAQLATNTSLWVQKPLQRLLASTHPSLTVYTGDTPPTEPFDFACSFLSLPVRFHTTSETIPPAVPYRLVSPKDSINWKELIRKKAHGNRYNIGVVWAGNPKHLDDRRRSIPFAIFESLFSICTVNWVSLQVGLRAEELETTSYPVMNFSRELVDFMATAKLIEALDLVITVDSAVAHLAGTLGKRTWVLLSFDADWRWQLEREDSPWYPSVRLFRQRTLNDWPEVLERVKMALQELL